MSSPLILAAALLLGGCGAQRVLATYPAPESAALDAAPWPRLVDTPDPATTPAPDPSTGAGLVTDLSAEAAVAAAESERLSAPVIDSGALRAEAAAVREAAAAQAAAPVLDAEALRAEAAAIRAAAEAAAAP